MVEVNVWGSLSTCTDNQKVIQIEATSIRGLLRELVEKYPGAEPWVKRGISVSIDGEIIRDDWSKVLPEEAEIFLIPRMTGG